MSTNSSGDRRVGMALVAAGAAVLLAAAAVVFAVTRDGGDSADQSATPATPTVVTQSAAPTVQPPSQAAPGAPPTASGTSAAPTSKPSTPNRFGYQPLWPFATEADAAAWQQSYREGGHQPWHLDASTIALMFTQQYLGYASVDRIVLTQFRGSEAWITVGYDYPDDASDAGLVAAVLHLVRFGTGDDAPWEVVGTEDRTLTLSTPRYGSQVSSPITVGGRITGVDESLDIQVRQVGNEQPVGTVGQIPAGGTDTPWTATVPVTASCPGTLTIAVATGGHVTDVERFAVTGVRC